MWWLILIIVVCLYYYSRKRYHYFSSRGVRTLPPTPFLGNLTAVTFGRENFVEAIAAGYERFTDQRYFGLYQFLVPTLVPRDPELIRNILVRDFNSFHDRGAHIDVDCDPLFSKNLLMLSGSKWRCVRTSLTPAFSSSRCRGMAPLMVESAQAVATHLQTKLTKDEVLDIDHITISYMNDVIASCAFGFAVDSLKGPNNCIFELGKKAIVHDTTQIMKLIGYGNMKSVMKAPAGIHAWIPVFSIHRDEKYWANPNVYDPERFTPERKAEIVPYTYLPFGNGPRHCIGSRFALLAVKVFLVKFLRMYRIRALRASPRLSP